MACLPACRRLVLWLMAWLAPWLLVAGSAGAQALSLAQARATVQIGGQEQHLDTTLPYAWDKRHRGARGHAQLEMSFTLDALPDEPWLLYFQRLGNAYEVRLNGALLDRKGDLQDFDGDDFGQVPRLISIPVGMLQAQNTLHVSVRADVARRAGVASPVLGLRDDVLPLYEQEYLQRVTGTRVVVVVSLLVGTLALALWWTQVDPTRGIRRDPLYLYAALAEYAWSLRVGDALLVSSPLSRFWWETFFIESIGVWVGAMLLFSALAAGWPGPAARQRMRVAWWWVLALGAPAAAAAQSGRLWVLTAWYALIGLVAVPFIVAYCGAALRRGHAMHRLVALALLLNALVGVHDWLVFRVQVTLGGNTLLRYSSLVFNAVLAYIVLMRFREASAQVRVLISTMGQRIAAREEELRASYERVEQLAREQARESERTRILRDLHDGVGAHISAAMRQLQSGKASSADVLQTLRDSLDQLKLSIDAMHLPDGDVTGLLANLRYRLEPRLSAVGIDLAWDVDLLSPVRRLDAVAMRHLQFMVLESLSNVLQHARASRLRVEAKLRGQAAVIRIEDNGIGFDVVAASHRGLRTLRERAKAIGAILDIRSGDQGSVVEIVVPF